MTDIASTPSSIVVPAPTATTATAATASVASDASSPDALPRRGVHPEDVFLYVFSLILLIVISGALLHSEKIIADKLVLQNAPSVEKSDLGRSYLVAQMDLSVRRYQQANGVLLARTARINGAFLLGASMLLFGCLLVIRRVRDVPITAKMNATGASLELITGSPGTYMSFLGAVVIVVCLLTTGNVVSNDAGIAFPPVVVRDVVPDTKPVNATGIQQRLDSIKVN